MRCGRALPRGRGRRPPRCSNRGWQSAETGSSPRASYIRQRSTGYRCTDSSRHSRLNRGPDWRARARWRACPAAIRTIRGSRHTSSSATGSWRRSAWARPSHERAAGWGLPIDAAGPRRFRWPSRCGFQRWPLARRSLVPVTGKEGSSSGFSAKVAPASPLSPQSCMAPGRRRRAPSRPCRGGVGWPRRGRPGSWERMDACRAGGFRGGVAVERVQRS